MVGVQLEGAGGAKPLVGPGRALLAVEALTVTRVSRARPAASSVGVGGAFQHRQVGLAELASQWRQGRS